MQKVKILRTTTASTSLSLLLRGQLRFLSKDFEILGLVGDETFLQEIEEREGVKVLHTPIRRSISLFNDIVSLFRTIALLRKLNVTIIHSMTPKAGLISMLAGYLVGVPVRMHTFTGLIFPTRSGFMQKVLITMDRLICFCATSIYPEGNGVKQDLINYKITSKELKVLGNGNVNGLDFDHYNIESVNLDNLKFIREKSKITEESITFLFIGRVVKDKGIVELVQSFVQVYLTNNNVRLLLVGPLEPDLDPLPKDVLTIITKHPGIILLGFQKDVRPYIAVSDILVFPSYREGFPNVPLQCGAFKKPLILSDINGCNEIVEHEVSGLLVPPKNVDRLINAMAYLLKNEEKRTEFGEAVYRHILSNFRQEEVWNALKTEYQIQLKSAGIDV